MYRARPFLKLAPALCLCAPLAAWRNITTADNDARPSYTREESGQVGNVTWEGHSLCDILRSRYPLECGEEERAEDSVYHVVFTGADEFESSTPLSTLLSRGDAILATRMNGSPLSRDHGHPVRAVLPGHVGCRNVKWLESIKLSKSPSSLPWNQRYYKDADGQHIQMLPSLQSIIFSASASSAGKLTVCGVAYTNGDASVSRVDVTTDGGKTWSAANVLRDDKEAGAPAKYSWSRWTATVDAPRPPKGEGQVTVHSRATDSAGGVQPEKSKSQNGYVYNGWGKATATRG